MSVKTGKQHAAGTDANVFIKIFGSSGDTGTLKLMSADNNKNKFEAGRIDLFKLESTDIGKVSANRTPAVGVSAVGFVLERLVSKITCYVCSEMKILLIH